LPLELRKFTGPFLKNPLAFFIPNLFLFAFDAVNCYLLGLHLHVTIGKEKKLTQRQRNRAMMAKDHKGSVRIDTPPPAISFDQLSKSQKSKGKESVVGEILKSLMNENSSRKI
jgi:hypothetical protein